MVGHSFDPYGQHGGHPTPLWAAIGRGVLGPLAQRPCMQSMPFSRRVAGSQAHRAPGVRCAVRACATPAECHHAHVGAAGRKSHFLAQCARANAGHDVTSMYLDRCRTQKPTAGLGAGSAKPDWETPTLSFGCLAGPGEQGHPADGKATPESRDQRAAEMELAGVMM